MTPELWLCCSTIAGILCVLYLLFNTEKILLWKWIQHIYSVTYWDRPFFSGQLLMGNINQVSVSLWSLSLSTMVSLIIFRIKPLGGTAFSLGSIYFGAIWSISEPSCLYWADKHANLPSRWCWWRPIFRRNVWPDSRTKRTNPLGHNSCQPQPADQTKRKVNNSSWIISVVDQTNRGFWRYNLKTKD